MVAKAVAGGVTLAIVVVLLVLVLGAAGVVGTAYTSSSSFCASCHEMTTRYVSWTRSTHADVECMDCHSGVGVMGYVNAKIGGVRQMWQHHFGTIGDIHVEVEDAVCLKCHFFSKAPDFVYEQGYQDDPLYVPDALHQVHFDDPDAACAGCHFGIVHGSLTGGIPIDRSVCDDCHREKKVLVEFDYDGREWSFPDGIKNRESQPLGG